MIVVDLIAVLFMASTGEYMVEQGLDLLLLTDQLCLKHLQLELIWSIMDESQTTINSIILGGHSL